MAATDRLPGPVSGERDTLRYGDLVLDESRWTVHRAGTPVDLSPTEFRLLACLMRHQGRALSRTELLREVWGDGYTGQPQVVETYVSYLRRKLSRLGPPLIHTRRGIGYTLGSLDTPVSLDPLDDLGVNPHRASSRARRPDTVVSRWVRKNRMLRRRP
jgi:DNA-binding response OmpR family regulator